jgi:hypothetical protein
MAEVAAFFDGLCKAVPLLLPTWNEHLQDNDGELLGHCLMADMLRELEVWLEQGRRAQVEARPQRQHPCLKR